MLNKMTAAVLFVKNLEICKTFYQDLPGFKATFSDDVSVAYQIDGFDFVLLKEEAAIEMISEEALAFNSGTAHRTMLCVQVEDVDATYNVLTTKGVAFIKAPKSQDWGRRTAYLLTRKAISGNSGIICRNSHNFQLNVNK